MNLDDSKESRACSVRSKYFTDNPVMDESLSDFQETKKSCTGPKNTAKTKTSNPKKAKRIRGQKDIRALLKSKRSELESYTKDFDSVCLKAGIDIDPEKLQLAIALSKSLQETVSPSNEASQSSELVNTQDRIKRIRTTLQEYGFKVPEVKIAKISRKIRKHRKDYKLISTSDTEKNEITANRYSQILFQDLTHCNFCSCEVNVENIPLYNLATNAAYNMLKITDTFYVSNLIEKSTGTANLLRDWSNIPGRPVSPHIFEPSNMNFSEIECSQDELDIVLSGTLKRCKDVIKTKNVYCDSKIVVKTANSIKVSTIINENDKYDCDKTLNKEDNIVECLPVSTQQIRSCSPDIFDDDALSILDQSKHSTVQDENITSNEHTTVPRTKLVTVDLTTCVMNKTADHQNICCENQQMEPILINNITQRKSNDFMEITDCKLYSSNNYTITENIGTQNIPKLSQKSLRDNITKRLSNDFMEITECVATLSQCTPVDNNIDLTQAQYIIDNRKIMEENKPVQDAATKVCEKTNTVQKEDADKSIESMDLTQSSNSSDELPLVSMTAGKQNSLDATIIIDINEYTNIIHRETSLQELPKVHIDLTQYSETVNEPIHSQSFFEEYIHDHSDSTEDQKEKNLSITGSPKSNSGKIDLTQKDNNVVCKKDNYTDCDKEKSAILTHKHRKLTNIDLTLSSKTRSRKKDSKSNIEHQNSLPSHSKTGDEDLIQSPVIKPTSSKNNCLKTFEEPVCTDNESSYIVNKQSKSNKVNLTLSLIENFNDADDESDVDLTQRSDISEELNDSQPKHDSAKSNNNSRIANCSDVNSIDLIHKSEISEDTSKSKCKHNFEKSNTTSMIESCNVESDIDLTQNSDKSEIYDIQSEHDAPNVPCEEDQNQTKNSHRCSHLGRKDEISIDYDDIIFNNVDCDKSNTKSTSSQSNIYKTFEKNIENYSRNNSFTSNCSQHSEVFEISDKELDYSLQQSKLEMPKDNFVFGGISVMDELSNLCASKKSLDTDVNHVENDQNYVEILPEMNLINSYKYTSKELSPIKHRWLTEIVTPQKASHTNNLITVTTPQNSELSIKTNDVTPMLDYDSMSLTEIHEELDKYGIKPFKRKRDGCWQINNLLDRESEDEEGEENVVNCLLIAEEYPLLINKFFYFAIKLLTHIYNQTHPIIEAYDDDIASPSKRHKPNEDPSVTSPRKRLTPRKLLRSPRKEPEVNIVKENHVITLPTDTKRGKESIKNKNVQESSKEHVNRNKNKGKGKDSLGTKKKSVTEDVQCKPSGSREVINGMVTEVPIIKEIECKPEDWVFQKREKAKVHSCRVPLHIAFYNYVSSRRDLREAILCYEPVEIDVIHKDLVGYGHRYDPKDLLKFLDKKCITVKTTDNDARNQKR